MNEMPRHDPSGFFPNTPDERGMVFCYHFNAAGMRVLDPAEAHWTWRSYLMSDPHARQTLAGETTFPAAVRDSFLAAGFACHLDIEQEWLFGDLPDLRHDYSHEARGLGHFRFALSENVLVGARKQPLKSVENVRRMVESGSRAFKAPHDLIEAVISQSLEGMGAELIALGDRLDGIEDRIVCDAWHNERQALVDARRSLVAIHRQMAALTSLFRHLDHTHHHDLPPLMADMATRLSNRALALHHDGEQLQARARLLQDELMAKLSAQSNRLLYVISIMTAVLLPATIISGLFGMNVDGLPFTGYHAGFWIVSALALGVAGMVFMIVRRVGSGM